MRGAAAELDWDDLRYFLRAAEERTLAGAARLLGVEHTTIGRRVSALERTLGAALLLRGPDGLRLTPLGERLVPLVEEVERAVLAVQALAASRKAGVRLAVPSGFTRLFAAALGRLHREHPGLSLELVSGARAVDLKKGEADLAIRGGPVTDKDLVARALGPCGFALYASDGYLAGRPAVDPDDLSGHEVIGYDPILAQSPAARWIEARVPRAAIVLRSREMTDMLVAAASGVGVTVLPCLLGDPDPSLRRLTPSPVATLPLFLVYRREARLSAEVRAVLALAVEVMKEQAARVRG